TGDECHMCFHFPLMPRMFMAVQMEDRHPIIDILDQTPAIPETSQWALFLRNHDELTLEMVTDEERDYMYRAYAKDPRARVNLGIRRRLAPLMGNDRRRIELMNALLFSLPGTPVLYYGDEIGMGDNVHLGDRNGVRTPMQWSADRNAGFSKANRQRLFLPVITDPEYHFEAVNVEAQQGNPESLLWWTKRLIAVRKQYRVFGHGSLTFLHPENRKVLAFVREFEDERVLVVANLSRFAQYAELDLAAFAGNVPVEMFGQGSFPPLGERPFVVTLGPHSFYWLRLMAPNASATSAAAAVATLPASHDLESLLGTHSSRSALLAALPAYFRDRRWFGGKSRRIREIRLVDTMPVLAEGLDAALVLFSVDYADGEPDTYDLPLALGNDEIARRIVAKTPGSLIARVGGKSGPILYDASLDTRFDAALLDVVAARKRIRGAAASGVAGHTTSAFKRLRGGKDANVKPVANRLEQSNTSLVYGDRFILKLYRRVESGINPDVEIGRVLTDAGFAHAPAMAGWIERVAGGGDSMALGLLQELVPNQGDLWSSTNDELRHFYERALTSAHLPPDPGQAGAAQLLPSAASTTSLVDDADSLIGPFIDVATTLAQRTAELHIALARTEGPAFKPEPFSALYQRSLYQGMRTQVVDAIGLWRSRPWIGDAEFPSTAMLAGREAELQARFRRLLTARFDGQRIRIHGDYHLGQVLWRGRELLIIDFEGEPARPMSERRHKRSPLRDVASMVRSFGYAAQGSLLDGSTVRPEDRAALEPWSRVWQARVSRAYVGAYLEATAGSGLVPEDPDQLVILLDALLLSKALHELVYELNHRPDWAVIPLAGILDLIGAEVAP
ncbi:MAG: putative maltokinase, partial [Candidatus Limnocylindrales bacterium]